MSGVFKPASDAESENRRHELFVKTWGSVAKLRSKLVPIIHERFIGEYAAHNAASIDPKMLDNAVPGWRVYPHLSDDENNVYYAKNVKGRGLPNTGEIDIEDLGYSYDEFNAMLWDEVRDTFEDLVTGFDKEIRGRSGGYWGINVSMDKVTEVTPSGLAKLMAAGMDDGMITNAAEEEYDENVSHTGNLENIADVLIGRIISRAYESDWDLQADFGLMRPKPAFVSAVRKLDRQMEAAIRRIGSAVYWRRRLSESVVSESVFKPADETDVASRRAAAIEDIRRSVARAEGFTREFDFSTTPYYYDGVTGDDLGGIDNIARMLEKYGLHMDYDFGSDSGGKDIRIVAVSDRQLDYSARELWDEDQEAHPFQSGFSSHYVDDKRDDRVKLYAGKEWPEPEKLVAVMEKFGVYLNFIILDVNPMHEAAAYFPIMSTRRFYRENVQEAAPYIIYKIAEKYAPDQAKLIEYYERDMEEYVVFD